MPQACPDGCLIGTRCFADGTVDPESPCRICDISRSRTALSDHDGAACDDGLYCTVGDVCAAGACGGTARTCDDGIACTAEGECDEGADACGPGAPACTGSELCDAASGECVLICTGCVIDGTCFGAGQLNPANPCEVCAPALSSSAWSANDGARCDDGLFCTVSDACTGTVCGGTTRDCADPIACNGTETCDETADACVAGTSTCGDGLLCDPAADACVTTCSGCVIDGVCYAPSTTSPSNPCLICAPASSTSDWTANDGARCDDDLFCTDGDACSGGTCAGTGRDCGDGVACNGAETCDETADACVAGTSTCASTEVCDVTADLCRTTCSGCVIGGVCYGPSTTSPDNPCHICRPASSTSDWTVNTGAACDDGLFCTVGDACSAAAVCGGSPRSCSDSIACNGLETCNESSDRCDAGTSTCTGGRLCDTSTDTCVLSCVGGTEQCGSTCVDTDHDPANCGGCGSVCGIDHVATPFCSSGTCGFLCAPGFGDCDGVGTNGCEQDLLQAEDNCGGCGIDCAAGEYCRGGTCHRDRLVFVTSTFYNAGRIGGLAGADEQCQFRAARAGLDGTFRAWISDSTTSASSRLAHSTFPYVLLDGSVVADDWTDLTDGTIGRPINRTETNEAALVACVHTGTSPDGTLVSTVDHCLDWTTLSDSHGLVEGSNDRSDGGWSSARTWFGYICPSYCNLYCFEQ